MSDSENTLPTPRALTRAHDHAMKVIALAKEVAKDRDDTTKNFLELAEGLAVKIGETIDLLDVGRTADARSLLLAIMKLIDGIADPVRRGVR